MLIEWWELLRGYHKWTPTEATVQSAIPSPIAPKRGTKSASQFSFACQSACTIQWHDQHHHTHTAVFHAYEESPLYQLSEDDKLHIRFNPSNPSRYYLPGLLQSQLTRTWRTALLTLMMILLIILALAYLIPLH